MTAPCNLRPRRGKGRPSRLYVGMRHHHLVILEHAGVDDMSRSWWHCRCDCGGEKTVLGISLYGSGTTKSCGCLQYVNRQPWSKQTWEVEMREAQRNNANRRGGAKPWHLTLEEFKSLVMADCHYCGVAHSKPTKVGKLVRNGIDRVDGSIGYEAGNCVTCCTRCNMMKGTMSAATFISQARAIAQRHPPPLDSNV